MILLDIWAMHAHRPIIAIGSYAHRGSMWQHVAVPCGVTHAVLQQFAIAESRRAEAP